MASSWNSRNQSEIEWLYPDLLSSEGLIHILKQRYIGKYASYLESLDKESLVELYNQYILPLPQRKYRHNRHGQEMSKRQILHTKKRRITIGDEDATSSKRPRNSAFQESCGPASGLINNFNGSSLSPTSRLKPPPSCINLDKKVVQLNSSRSPLTSPSQPSCGGDKKIVKLKSSSGDDGCLPSSKRIKLDDDKVSPGQKAFSKITWP